MSLRLENEIHWQSKCNRLYFFHVFLANTCLRLENEIQWHSKCNRLYLFQVFIANSYLSIHITTRTQHTFTHDAARRNYRWYYTTRRWIGGWCWAQTRQPRYPTCSTSIFPPKFARSGTRCVCSKKECVCTNCCNAAVATNDCSVLGYLAVAIRMRQHTAPHCNTLLHTVTHGETLQHKQHTATHQWQSLLHFAIRLLFMLVALKMHIGR